MNRVGLIVVLLLASSSCGATHSADGPVLNASYLTPTDFPSMHLATWAVNFGEVEEEPLMLPQHPWDEEIGGKGTILVDPIDHLYKAWYVSQPGVDYTGYDVSEGHARMISYAYSHDGVDWIRPQLDIIEWNGNKTNLLLRLPHDKECDYACVFVDPEATNSSQRYEMFALLSASPAGFPPSTGGMIYRFFSADGVHWNPAGGITKGPCPGGTWCSDSLYINKLQGGGYQAIIKHGPATGPGGLAPFDVGAGITRWIYVSNSTDGEDWTPALLAFSPDWRDPASFQVISSISTIQAADGSTVGWLPVFDTMSQTIDMQFIVSKDGGVTWWRPERRSAVPARELGTWGGGMMWPFRKFVLDRDDPTKLHAYFSGCQGRHADIHSTLAGERFATMRKEWTSYGEWGYTNIKDPFTHESYNPVKSTNFFRGALMRATWDPRRLWALIPVAGGDIPGYAVTGALSVAGKRLLVNVQLNKQTRGQQLGSLAAELLNVTTGDAIPGFGIEDCAPVSEDGYEQHVQWKGGPVVPVSATSVQVRFKLLRARLYNFQWQ